MMTPQTENGYTRIANELFEAMIVSGIPSANRKVLDTIIRYTYGYNKKTNFVSMENFRVLTGLRAPNVCRCISELVKANVIVVIRKDKIVEYGVNKDYSSWLCFRRRYDWRSGLSTRITHVVSDSTRNGLQPELSTGITDTELSTGITNIIHTDNDIIPTDNNFILTDNNSVVSGNNGNGLQHLKTTLKTTLKTKDNTPPKPRIKKEFTEEITSVIDFFNSLTDSRLLVKAKGNRIPIKARLRDGYTVEDCKQVIKNKWEQWGQDDKMYKYVRIVTLFSPTHFDAYLNEKGARYDELEDKGFIKSVAKR